VGLHSRKVTLSRERQEQDDLVPDLFFRHVLRDENDVIDGPTDGLLVRRYDEARHWLPRCHALVRETNNRIPIIGDQDSVLYRGPGKDIRVGRTFRQGVKGPHQVELWQAAAQAADDRAVDICVTG
jgi:hypothetical protein